MRSRGDSGFSLIEVVIAMVMLVILAMGMASSLGAAFMADAVARDTARSAHAAQQVLEELQPLQYADVLGEDGTAALTPQGVAVKISAHEAMVGMIMVEVFACRPTPPRSLADLGAMSMAQVKRLPAAPGSQVRVITYRAGRGE